MADQAMPEIVNPVQDYGQVDYRRNPNAGTDRPVAGGTPVQPWTDQTWAAYDEATDASRYRGINSPEEQARLHLSPNPAGDSQGWSPDKDPAR